MGYMNYEERLEVAKRLYELSNDEQKTALECIFPELCESEDERIRKELIGFLRNNPNGNYTCEEMAAWLEKQEGCECIKKDWLEHIKQSWYKEGFIDGKYSTSKEWTKNDAATLKELIDFLENGTAKLQHDLTRYANWLKIQFTPIEKQGNQKLPIEKLPEEMKTIGESLGFTTQEECDEYNQMVSDLIVSDDKGEQKSAWSEEDMKEALRTEYEKGKADSFAQMQKEWSEEDEQYLLVCKNALAKYQTTDKWDADIISCWLENKLKAPQNTWKPSDEQMEALNQAKTDACGKPYFKALASLYVNLQ